MTFNKEFFEGFNGRLRQYHAEFSISFIMLTIKTAFDREFNVNRIIAADDEFLTFAHYENKKQLKLPKQIQDKTGEITAFPVVILPYAAIQWVEINPGELEGAKSTIGFNQKASFFRSE